MPILFKRYYPIRNIAFFLGEGLLIFSIVIFMQVIIGCEWNSFNCQTEYVFRSAVVTVVFLLCLYFFDLYDLGVVSSFSDTAVRITQAFGVGCIILAAFYYLFPTIIISTKAFWSGYLAVCFGIAGYRSLYFLALRKRMFTQPIIILGEGCLAKRIYNEINNRMDSGFHIVACVSPNPLTFTPEDNCKVFTKNTSLPELVIQEKAERVVVAMEDRRGTTPIKELIACRLGGAIVSNGVNFYEQLTGKILVETANPDWIIYSGGFKKSRTGTFCKRCFDVVLASFGLLVSLPISLVSAIIIKLESSGPVLYSQERVGENNHSFMVIKFRSMRQDAEKNGAVWAVVNDNRVTRFGGFMRKVRIDEIPQMWNILVGDMSFVGPRPERPVFVKELTKNIPYYAIRHAIKPGLTGWAQICYPYGASEEDALRKLEYDLYYLKNMAMSLDLWITFQTIKTVLFKKGSR